MKRSNIFKYISCKSVISLSNREDLVSDLNIKEFLSEFIPEWYDLFSGNQISSIGWNQTIHHLRKTSTIRSFASNEKS